METPFSPFTPEPTKPSRTDWFDKYQYYILAGLSLGLVAGIYFTIAPKATLPHSAGEQTDSTTTSAEGPSATTGQIVVDVAGAIANAGVYYLAPNSIVEDAIKAAGGLSKSADLDAIAHSVNRAELVQAHSKIYIPKKGDSRLVYTQPEVATNTSTTPAAPQGTKININTASVSELDVLPGIGPVIAQRIIDHRLTSGNFTTIDAIKNVAGISEGKYDQIKDLISV